VFEGTESELNAGVPGRDSDQRSVNERWGGPAYCEAGGNGGARKWPWRRCGAVCTTRRNG